MSNAPRWNAILACPDSHSLFSAAGLLRLRFSDANVSSTRLRFSTQHQIGSPTRLPRLPGLKTSLLGVLVVFALAALRTSAPASHIRPPPIESASSNSWSASPGLQGTHQVTFAVSLIRGQSQRRGSSRRLEGPAQTFSVTAGVFLAKASTTTHSAAVNKSASS
jgi:hypothetical protein